jgi:hypothetical protein
MTAVFREGHREGLSTFGLGFCINWNRYVKLKTKLELVSCLFKSSAFNYFVESLIYKIIKIDFRLRDYDPE